MNDLSDTLNGKQWLERLECLADALGNEGTPVRTERIGRLYLLRPPMENLIASKLIRGDARDVTDILFLIHHYRPDPERIRQIVASFSPRSRHQAEENLV